MNTTLVRRKPLWCDVLADRGLNNDVDLTNCWPPPLEEPRDTPREDVTTKCLSPQRDETEVKLHNDVLLEIIRWSLIGDCSMLGTLNRVSQTFRDLTRSFQPLIHKDDHLIDKLKLGGAVEKNTSFQKVMRFVGETSGLAMRLRYLFSCNTRWYMTSICVLCHTVFCIYII